MRPLPCLCAFTRRFDAVFRLGELRKIGEDCISSYSRAPVRWLLKQRLSPVLFHIPRDMIIPTTLETLQALWQPLDPYFSTTVPMPVAQQPQPPCRKPRLRRLLQPVSLLRVLRHSLASFSFLTQMIYQSVDPSRRRWTALMITTTLTYDAASPTQSITLPCANYDLNVELHGASGGQASGGNNVDTPPKGGFVSGTFSAQSPNQVIYFVIGAQGGTGTTTVGGTGGFPNGGAGSVYVSNGYGGGGGGGATQMFSAAGNQLLAVAGGAGGNGGFTGRDGGGGGGLVGGAGTVEDAGCLLVAGQGGTQAAGGKAGNLSTCANTGTFNPGIATFAPGNQGDNAGVGYGGVAVAGTVGGGGGGGYHGGGGGAFGGGGGGSSFYNSTLFDSVNNTQAGATYGNGRVVLTYYHPGAWVCPTKTSTSSLTRTMTATRTGKCDCFRGFEFAVHMLTGRLPIIVIAFPLLRLPIFFFTKLTSPNHHHYIYLRRLYPHTINHSSVRQLEPHFRAPRRKRRSSFRRQQRGHASLWRLAFRCLYGPVGKPSDLLCGRCSRRDWHEFGRGNWRFPEWWRWIGLCFEWVRRGRWGWGDSDACSIRKSTSCSCGRGWRERRLHRKKWRCWRRTCGSGRHGGRRLHDGSRWKRRDAERRWYCRQCFLVCKHGHFQSGHCNPGSKQRR